MDTERFTHISGQRRGHSGQGPQPGLRVARADRLRALLAAEEFLINTASEIATNTTSPTEAAALALVVERAHRRTAYTQILAAQCAQRTLAHELPVHDMEQLVAVIDDPEPFIDGETDLPDDPLSPPAGRLPHKDTSDFLHHLLGTGYFEVQDRVRATTAFLPHVDEHGIQQPARYPLLAAEALAGTVEPRLALQAVKKLDKVGPVIRKRPDSAALAVAIESEVRDSLRTQGPQATGKLITAWQNTLEEAATCEPDPEVIGAKTGIFLTRRTEHFTYFSLCMLNVDAEIFLSHFANADNARTAAGNRANLARDAAGGSTGPRRNG